MPIRILLALAALIAAVPAHAQGDDAELLRTMRAIGDATSGQTIGRGQAADKIVYLGRANGGLVIVSVAALIPGGEGVDPPPGCIALLRTRAAAPAPLPADFALAERTRLPIFILAESGDPPAIWEVVGARFREIDARGAPGAWRTPAG
jgi:hypothetical protein